jgi:hypothetical protein
VRENKKSVLTTIKNGQFIKGNKKILLALSIIMATATFTLMTACARTEKNNDELGNTYNNLIDGGTIAERENWIYYSTNTGLYKMTKDGSDTTKLYDKPVSSINIMGEWVYFITEDKQVLKINTDGSTVQDLTSDGKKFDLAFVTKNHLYFYSFSGKTKMYMQNIDGTNLKELPTPFLITSAQDGDIYALKEESRNVSPEASLYTESYNKYDTEGNVKEKLQEIEVRQEALYSPIADGKIYYKKRPSGLYSYNMTDKTETQIIKDMITDYSIYNGYIYYLILQDQDVDPQSGQPNIYKVALDGSGKEKVAALPDGFSQRGFTQNCKFDIAGDWIICHETNQNIYYSINIKSGEKAKLD